MKCVILSFLLLIFLSCSALRAVPPLLTQARGDGRISTLTKVMRKSIAILAASASFSSSSTLASSGTEEYLPRKLYPGSYGQFCGPTPEITPSGGCVAHGWHGDTAQDLVDDACRLHDISYCQCEAGLNGRTGGKEIGMLASKVALRGYGPLREVLRRDGADPEYLMCIDAADKDLVKKGLALRAREERLIVDVGDGAAPLAPEDAALSWFREKDKGNTLNRFEQVNLRVFLASLDSDTPLADREGRPSLTQLEAVRERDLSKALKLNGGRMALAAADRAVVRDDEKLLSAVEGEGP
jgi:hypothetical protein